MKRMNRNFWIGLGLLIASYGAWLVPHDWALAHHFQAGFPLSFGVAFFAFGTIFFCEGVVQRLGGQSLMQLSRGGGVWRALRFFVVAALVGILLEIFAQWLGKLWFYAYYPHWFYWPALVPSFALYWVVITETYMAAKALLDRLIRRGGREKPGPISYHSFEPYLYGWLGVLGAGLFVFGTVRAFFEYVLNGGFIFDPYTESGFAPPLRFILLACFGLWMLFEALQYMRQAPSLLRSLLHGYFVPVLAVIMASAVTSLIWESQNAVVDYWVYTHLPWPDLRLLGVQLSVFLVWPTHYLVYLSLPIVMVPSWGRALFARRGPKQQTAQTEEI